MSDVDILGTRRPLQSERFVIAPLDYLVGKLLARQLVIKIGEGLWSEDFAIYLVPLG